jgi:soluble lytic murein transglycosylase
LNKLLRGILATTSLMAMVAGMADAQTAPTAPVPYGSLPGARPSPPPGSYPTSQPSLITSPGGGYAGLLNDQDAYQVNSALLAARTGNAAAIIAARDSMSDPLARRIAEWALVDAAPTAVSFAEMDQARRDLAGWPRAAKRQAAAERLIETGGLTPAQVVAWFDGAEPTTAEGAMALASALQATYHGAEAQALVRHFWRDRVFEADVQARFLARFGSLLTQDDHIRRADILLYGQQGPAARDVIALLPTDQQTLANARMALRNNSLSAESLLQSLPSTLVLSPGLVLERMAFYRRRGQMDLALTLAATKSDAPTDEAAAYIWKERKQLVAYALKKGDFAGAYAAAAGANLQSGSDGAESEFFAGWLALVRLKDPDRAAVHFANLNAIGASPITRGRALYWQGRAAEAQGDPIAAQAFYSEGARYITTFYGQLAAEKVGVKTLVLGKDPVITAADRTRFEGRDVIRAARVLAQIGARDTFKVFVLATDDTLPTAAEEALLVDLARSYGDQDLAMRAVRTAAQRGFILPERGYPLLPAPSVPGGAETAFVFSITRQESNFDPSARSAPGARGMMQLMPATAAYTARRLGEPYSIDRLFDADYNMRLGAKNLGMMIDTFGGSYLMAAAAYNAGPGRPTEWITACGDPRGGGTDPLDYIECIPFSETRNYVMRTLETTMVYRARLNGGEAPLTLSADLKRGGYTYGPPPETTSTGGATSGVTTGTP